MANRTIIPTLKINKNLNIGTVVFVVEGAVYEYRLLTCIFVNVFNYYIKTNKTNHPDFKELVSKNNPHDRVIIIRTDSSAIKSIRGFADYRDELYARLFIEHDIDIKNSPVFYIWDRDCGSNPSGLVRSLLSEMSSPIGGEKSVENGLLLLSYPCAEAFVVNCNEESLDYLPDNITIKAFVGSRRYSLAKLDDNLIKNGARRMFEIVSNLGVSKLDLDDMADYNLAIFDAEEAIYEKGGQYHLLSLIFMALLNLGLVSEDTFK